MYVRCRRMHHACARKERGVPVPLHNLSDQILLRVKTSLQPKSIFLDDNY